ncbi:MAG: EpsD family peptidyl-prolyl cis-trans isomerase [Acidobacteriota bacterium]
MLSKVRVRAHEAGRPWMALIGACLAVQLSACSRHDGAESPGTSQIAAQVNDKEISIHQVQTMIELQPALAQQFGEQASRKVLDSLIEQELAAQAARSAGLDTSPRVVQAMELAKREVLARAYQDQLAGKATMPDDAAITRYYDAHPELFANRRQYLLQETVIKAPTAQLQGVQDEVAKLPSAADVNAWVAKKGWQYSVRNSAQWAEALPMDLLSQLAARKPGQSVAVPRPDGMVILTVLGSDVAPQTLAQARGAIQEALWATRRKEQVLHGMESLRQQAKVLRFDEAAASSPTGASGPARGASAP